MPPSLLCCCCCCCCARLCFTPPVLHAARSATASCWTCSGASMTPRVREAVSAARRLRCTPLRRFVLCAPPAAHADRRSAPPLTLPCPSAAAAAAACWWPCNQPQRSTARAPTSARSTGPAFTRTRRSSWRRPASEYMHSAAAGNRHERRPRLHVRARACQHLCCCSCRPAARSTLHLRVATAAAASRASHCRYLEEKRAASPGLKIVTELEPVSQYYKAEVCARARDSMSLVLLHFDFCAVARLHVRLRAAVSDRRVRPPWCLCCLLISN